MCFVEDTIVPAQKYMEMHFAEIYPIRREYIQPHTHTHHPHKHTYLHAIEAYCTVQTSRLSSY